MPLPVPVSGDDEADDDYPKRLAKAPSDTRATLRTVLGRVGSHLLGNAVAYAALFVALGGTSYAAATLPRNSVGAEQLRNASVGAAKIKSGAVTKAKIRSNAITSAKIKNGTLLTRDFAPGQLKIALKTVKGPAGPQGPPGATNVAIRSVGGVVGADGRYTATAVCSPGERALGGGTALIGQAHTNDHVLTSRPGVATGSGGFGAGSNVPVAGDTPTAWTAEVYSALAGRTLSVYAICAAP